MFCNQTRLLKRISIYNPEALRTEPWQRHLQGCGACREELGAYERSLAVFRHVEGERVNNGPCGPEWSQMAAVLQRERVRSRSTRNWRVSLAAAFAGMACLTGLATWMQGDGTDPQPARVVELQPQQQVQLQELVNQTLEEPRQGRASEPVMQVSVQPPGLRAEREAARRNLERASDALFGPELVSPAIPVLLRQQAPRAVSSFSRPVMFHSTGR